MSLTFVVGTGRCGSTMLSHVLREHPDVLSVSEFFSTLKAAVRRREFPAEALDGRELWRMLATPVPMADAMIRAGMTPPEFCYPYETGRFAAETGIPIVCHCLLPGLSDDPDALFDHLADVVPRWPTRPAATQYRAFFAFLAGLLGRTVVVERSAPSLPLIPQLRREFPDARFVHMHRDGPDCALSMSRHPTFRREALLFEAVRAAGLTGPVTLAEVAAAAPERFRGLLLPPFDAARIMGYPLSLDAFGSQWWAAKIIAGLSHLTKLPLGEWTTVGYEDVLADPAAELARLAEFIGVPADPGWLAAARRMIDPARPGGAATLPPDELASLRAACEPGTAAIAKVAEWRRRRKSESNQ